MSGERITRPAVSNEVVVRTYDALAEPYDRLVGPLGSRTRTLALDHLGVAPGDHVLEVGCGPGRALADLARRVGPHGGVVGLDAAPRMLDRADRRLARTGFAPRVDLVAGDARALPLADGIVDAAFLEDTLELFDGADRERVLGELRRVLAPGGRLGVVTMERAGAEDHAFTRLYDWSFEHLPGYERVGCRPIYAGRALAANGFAVETVERHRRVGVWPVEILVARPA